MSVMIESRCESGSQFAFKISERNFEPVMLPDYSTAKMPTVQLSIEYPSA
ncbi:hypothetical protein NUG06_004532 [Yersinia enterocolitica]|nr:hypothetical protein [Yersinia enterocolitica]